MTVAAIAAWLVGIALADLLRVPAAGLAAGATGCAAAVLGFRSVSVPRHTAILLLALLLGALRLELDRPGEGPGWLAAYNDGPAVTIRGLVVADPEPRGDRTRLVVQAESLARPGGWQPLAGGVLADVAGARWPIGARVELTGRPRTPPEFADFSYRAYLSRRHLQSTLLYPRAQLVELDPRFAPSRALSSVRRWAQAEIEANLPGPEASLLSGILLGTREAIPDNLLEDFARSGTTHVIAISGYNMTLVAGLVVACLWLAAGRRRAALLALPLLWAYAFLVGAGASVVRAAIMATLYLLAVYLGRERAGLPSLALAAGIMTLVDPQTLWDVGFQLSFAATAGLLLMVPLLPRAPGGLPRMLTDVLATTLAAQLATAPLLVYYFQRFSLVAPMANLFALPALPPIMGTGALLLAGLAIWPASASLLAPLAEITCAYLIVVVQVASRLPLAEVAAPSVGLSALALYYAALAGSLAAVRPAPAKWLAARLPGFWPASTTGAWLLALAALMAAAFWLAVIARAVGVN